MKIRSVAPIVLWLSGSLLCSFSGQAGMAVLGGFLLWLGKECRDLDCEIHRLGGDGS